MLVYSVCTVLPEENEEIARRLLAEDRAISQAVPKAALPEEVKAVADPEGFLQTSPTLAIPTASSPRGSSERT